MTSIKAKDDQPKLLRIHARTSEASPRLKAMVGLAMSEADMVATPSDFDQHDMKLNLLNGTLDLTTGSLGPHNPTDYLTKLAKVRFEPDATCPQWLQFLSTIMNNDQSLVDYLQRIVGYTLTGRTDEQCLFILYGTGANGKSTFIEVVHALLGEYGKQTDFSTFSVKQSDGPRNDLARLVGMRFVAATETESGKLLSEVTVKSLTGTDTVTARFLHKEFFEFQPTFKIFIATNHKPVVKNTDEGIWRRMRLVPFEVTIPAERRDKGLREKLLAELPGILTWAVQGCLDWQRHGLVTPHAVEVATSQYRDEMDVFGAFLEEECVVVRDRKPIEFSSLYTAYKIWAESHGDRPFAHKRFSQVLDERGFHKVKTNGVRCIRGLRLITNDERIERGDLLRVDDATLAD
jgi:putative DNA primase/helicase